MREGGEVMVVVLCFGVQRERGATWKGEGVWTMDSWYGKIVVLSFLVFGLLISSYVLPLTFLLIPLWLLAPSRFFLGANHGKCLPNHGGQYLHFFRLFGFTMGICKFTVA